MYSDYFMDYVCIWNDPENGYEVTKQRWQPGIYFIASPYCKYGERVYGVKNDEEAIQLAKDWIELAKQRLLSQNARYAIETFSFLMPRGAMWSFDQLANEIETYYDLKNPKTRMAVEGLREHPGTVIRYTDGKIRAAYNQ